LFKQFFQQKKVFWLVSPFVLFLFLFSGEFFYFQERAVGGLFIGNQHLEGKTFPEIEEILDSLAEKMGKQTIYLNLPDDKGKVTYSLSEIGLELDKTRLMEEIKLISRPFNYPEKIHIFFNGLTLPAYLLVNNDKLQIASSRINDEILRLPVEAEVWAEKGILRFRPAQKGQKANIERLIEEIQEKCSSWPSFPLEFFVERETVYPEVTVSDLFLAGIKEEITMARTFFNPEATNRVHNISLAAEKIDNFLLTPGSVFSFNQLVGETSAQDGFKEAPIIVNGELIPGVGGGICQVSSTLYNAALKAGLTIVERHNHGLPIAYLPPGLDATVAYDYLDLKFQNNMETNLLIHTNVVNNRLDVYLFGDPKRLTEINIITRNKQLIPPPVHFRNVKEKPVSHREKIQEGKPGVTVEVYRIFSRDGEEVEREYLGKDCYSPVPEIWEIGLLSEED